jgi:hypothetical protein
MSSVHRINGGFCVDLGTSAIAGHIATECVEGQKFF